MGGSRCAKMKIDTDFTGSDDESKRKNRARFGAPRLGHDARRRGACTLPRSTFSAQLLLRPGGASPLLPQPNMAFY